MAASNATADLASATNDTTLAVANSAADVQDPHANAESDAADKPVLSKNQQKKLAKKER